MNLIISYVGELFYVLNIKFYDQFGEN